MPDFDSHIRIEIERQDDVCILALKGRLGAGVDSEQLRSKAEELKGRGASKVLVDARELSSIGSTGIGFVVGIYTSVVRNPAGRFILVGANGRVREAFDLTRLSAVIPMAPNLAAGLAALQGETLSARSAHHGSW